jgi:type VI protein secretion system component Hcp
MAGDLPDVYLRFEGYTGSCMDVDHPGTDGWIGIKNLTFGFGFPGKDKDAAKKREDKTKKAQEEKDKAKTKGKPEDKPKPSPTQGMTSGPMTFDPIKFSKSADVMSTPLMDACTDGTRIPKVNLECCRFGDTDEGKKKLPFVKMTFQDVYLKTCKLNLTSEGLPEESYEFVYETVTMSAVWTDNVTGKKLGDTKEVTWTMARGEVKEGGASDDD